MKTIIQILAIGGFIGLALLTALIISLNSIVAELEQDNYNEVYHFIPVQHDMILGHFVVEDDFVIQETEPIKQSDEVAYMLQTTRRATK